MKTITFTVCQRPHYMRETLASWALVRGIEDWVWNFHIEPTGVTDAQLRAIGDFAAETGVVVNPVVNPERFGVLVNPWHALNKAFDQGAEFVVLAEEDLIVSTDVLEYFDWAAKAGKAAPVGAVNARGYGWDEEGDQGLVAAKTSFSPHTWGTWPDRWYGYIRDTWDKDYSTGVDENQRGWDWNLDKRVFPARDAVVFRPFISRSQNIGQYDGVHQMPHDFDSSLAQSFLPVIGKTTYHF